MRLGFLYPLHGAEDDYPRLGAALAPPVEVRIVHTESADLHEVTACRQTGSRDYLLAGAEQLREARVDTCMWACTSGSFVYGVAGAQRQAREISEALSVPASSTSLAFLSAARALGVARVAVAATYPEGLAQAFRDFLTEGGIEVLQMSCLGLWTAAEVGKVGREEVLQFARANDHPRAEALLIPDTALHTAAFLPELDAFVGKPVLTANQVTMWEALRLAGYARPQSHLGRLMEVAGEGRGDGANH